MTGVLLRMELVRRRGAPREAVMTGELLVHARGRAIRSTVHRLDERQERYSFERRTILATRAANLDRSAAGCRGAATARSRSIECWWKDRAALSRRSPATP